MEVIYYSIYILLALFASAMVVLGLGFGLHLDRFLGRYAVPAIPVFIVLAIGISTVLSGRNVSFYGFSGLETGLSVNPLSGWILRLSTATTVGVAAVVALSAILRKNPGDSFGRPLFAAFTAYFMSSYVISGILGTEPSFVHKNFYAIIVFFAAYATRDQSLDRFVCWSRDGLNIFLWMGLLAAIILPPIAVQQGYGGIIPAVTFRLWGVATHANNLGPVAVVFILLLRWKPYRWWGLNLLGATAALISLIFSQSKTAWLAGAAALAVLWGYRVISAIRSRKSREPISLARLFLISGPFVLASSLLIALGIGLESGYGDRLLNNMDNQILTLTGRDAIWAITLQEWEHNPFFGYGPRLWGDEFAYRMGYFGVASNAHNQFVDVLGSSGVVGLLSLVAYLLILLKYAWSSMGVSKGFSLALAVFILVRCITEVPFKTGNVTTPDFLMHFILFAALLRAKYSSRRATTQINAWKQSSSSQASFSA
jgi:O-antigen ligase